jgi:hypothetical protein
MRKYLEKHIVIYYTDIPFIIMHHEWNDTSVF